MVPKGAGPKRYDVLAVGISAVDDLLYVSEYPTLNCKVPVIESARQGGGPACTAAAAVGTLGGRAAFVARWGRDDLSAYVASCLEQHRVDISHGMHDPSAAPYHSRIVVDRAGNRNVFYDASSYRQVHAEDVPDDLLQSSSLCLFDHIGGCPPLELVARTRRLGIPILIDVEGQTQAALDLAALADYLVVPEPFARWATGRDKASEACGLLAQRGHAVTVVTQGAEGCFYKTKAGKSVRHQPAFVIDAVDTNGCGDTFHGAFAFAVSRRVPVPAAVVFASAAAALKARAIGERRGWDALPTLAEVRSFLYERVRGDKRASVMQQLEALSG